MSIQIVLCPHSVDLRVAKCYLCGDPAFSSMVITGGLTPSKPDPRDSRIRELEAEVARLNGIINQPVPLSEWQKMERENDALRAQLGEAMERCDVLESAASTLLENVQEKGLPWDAPENVRLRSLGDIINVNESALWQLAAILHDTGESSPPKAEQEPATPARCGGTGRLDFGSMGDDCPGCVDCQPTPDEGRGRK